MRNWAGNKQNNGDSLLTTRDHHKDSSVGNEHCLWVSLIGTAKGPGVHLIVSPHLLVFETKAESGLPGGHQTMTENGLELGLNLVY